MTEVWAGERTFGRDDEAVAGAMVLAGRFGNGSAGASAALRRPSIQVTVISESAMQTTVIPESRERCPESRQSGTTVTGSRNPVPDQVRDDKIFWPG